MKVLIIPLAFDLAKEHTLKIIIDGAIAVAYFNNQIVLGNRAYILPITSRDLYVVKGNVQFKNVRL